METKIVTNNAEYILTTDHAASSYGQPVLVDANGTAFGAVDRIEAERAVDFGDLFDAPTARDLVETARGQKDIGSPEFEFMCQFIGRDVLAQILTGGVVGK